jgi:hypothetical protein
VRVPIGVGYSLRLPAVLVFASNDWTPGAESGALTHVAFRAPSGARGLVRWGDPGMGEHARRLSVRMGHLVRATAGGLAALLLVGSMSGCSFGLWVRSQDPREATYIQAVRPALLRVDQAGRQLHPVCDKGGSLMGCSAASDTARLAVEQLLAALDGVSVPANFRTAHQHATDGLRLERDGLSLRVSAIREHSDSKWTESNNMIGTGAERFNQALGEYPKGVSLTG